MRAAATSEHHVGTCTVRPAAARPARASGVSAPGDAAEVQAEAVARRVAHGAPPQPSRSPLPSCGVSRTATGRAFGGGPPPIVDRVLASPFPGTPMPAAVRARVEPHVGVDLSGVRVLTGPRAAVAAASIGARAFTAGPTIVLGRGQSPYDTRLMAHESAHVAQNALAGNRVDVHRATIMRDVADFLPSLPSLPDVSVTDVLPASVLDTITSAVRSLPGYTLLSQVIGVDPLTGAAVEADRQAMLDRLLSYGPFGAAVGAALQAVGALDAVAGAVTENLGRYGLTLARIKADVDAAWSQFSIANGIDGNLAIVEEVIDGILADVRRFVTDLVERILTLVREAAADLAEQLLTGDSALGPVWSLATEVFRYDPLRGVPVEAATVDILAGFLYLIGQDGALDQMRERGTLEATAGWLDEQLATFLTLLDQATSLFRDAWAAIQPENLASLPETLPGLVQRELALVAGVGTFAGTVLAKVLQLVKDSLLGLLSEHAYSIPGFRLISVIIGHNPFTGEPVPLTPETLIAGFITLLPGGEATYQELSASGVIPDAAARIESALATLGITPELVTSTFLGLWDTLSLDDLLDPLAAFDRVEALFGDPLVRILEFVTVVVQVVLELVLRLMGFPVELLQHVIAETTAAIEDIRNDPMGFLRNLVLALKLGLQSFFDKIGTYLLDGIVGWLFHGLAKLGITIPKDLSFASILGLILDVLGLSADFLWRKLGEHLGEEKVQQIRDHLDTLGGAWSFIRDVQERGITAIWEYVQSRLSTLWSTILEIAAKWIVETLIVQGTIKLLSFLDPTFIMTIVNGCIAFYQGVMSTIEYIREILQIIDDYVSTIAAIARGNLTPAAQKVEQGFAEALPVAIGFLAAQLGIGNVPNKIAEIILGIRQVVEAAIDWLIDQALKLGAAALDALGLGSAPVATAPSPVMHPPTTKPDSVKIPEGLPPDAIKSEALGRVQELLAGRRFETPAEFAAAVAHILELNRDRGLRALGLRVPDEETMDIQVTAEASPPATRVIPLATVFSVGTPPDPDDFAEQGMGTNAAVSVDGRMVGSVSRSKSSTALDPVVRARSHAEWILVDGPAWRQVIDMIEKPAPGTRVERVVLAINRAPCTYCSGHVAEALAIVLRDLRNAGVAIPAFVLAPTGIYEPGRDATQAEVDADRAEYENWARARGLTTKTKIDRYVERRTLSSRLDRSRATTWDDLEELVVAGWDLRALQVGPKLKPFGQVLAEAAHKLAVEFGRP